MDRLSLTYFSCYFFTAHEHFVPASLVFQTQGLQILSSLPPHKGAVPQPKDLLLPPDKRGAVQPIMLPGFWNGKYSPGLMLPTNPEGCTQRVGDPAEAPTSKSEKRLTRSNMRSMYRRSSNFHPGFGSFLLRQTIRTPAISGPK